jgi:hypothetical protein
MSDEPPVVEEPVPGELLAVKRPWSGWSMIALCLLALAAVIAFSIIRTTVRANNASHERTIALLQAQLSIALGQINANAEVTNCARRIDAAKDAALDEWFDAATDVLAGKYMGDLKGLEERFADIGTRRDAIIEAKERFSSNPVLPCPVPP